MVQIESLLDGKWENFGDLQKFDKCVTNCHGNTFLTIQLTTQYVVSKFLH